VSAYTAAVLADLPFGYWRLNDTTTSAVDSSGNGNTGTYTGTFAHNTVAGPAAAVDPTSGVCDLSGCTPTVAGYVTIPDATILNPTTSALTLECWVRTFNPATPTSAFAGLIYKYNSAGAEAYGIYHDGSGVYPQMNLVTAGGSVATSQAATSDDSGSWTHVVAVYNGAGEQMYINGATAGSAASETGAVLACTGSALVLGAIPAANAAYQCTMYLSECAAYSTALSAGRILAHFNAASCLPFSSGRMTSQAVARASSW
jgi:hypothetical protein